MKKSALLGLNVLQQAWSSCFHIVVWFFLPTRGDPTTTITVRFSCFCHWFQIKHLIFIQKPSWGYFSVIFQVTLGLSNRLSCIFLPSSEIWAEGRVAPHGHRHGKCSHRPGTRRKCSQCIWLEKKKMDSDLVLFCFFFPTCRLFHAVFPGRMKTGCLK